MNIALTGVALVSFVIYGYAIQKTFSHEYGVNWRMRALQITGTAFALAELWFVWQISNLLTIRSALSLIVYAAALVVFFAAKHALRDARLTLAFSTDSPQRLISVGIYSRVRHPFYLAYELTWTAGAIAAPSITTVTIAIGMLGIYMAIARSEERKFANSALASSYANYRTQAGMLWPRL